MTAKKGVRLKYNMHNRRQRWHSNVRGLITWMCFERKRLEWTVLMGSGLVFRILEFGMYTMMYIPD